MKRSLLAMAALLLFAASLVSPGQAAAADCPHGMLDKQYCDWDGDLVADLPRDEKQWSNPDTIIFAYTPVEDPAVYAKIWDGFIKHMSKVTGKKVAFFPVQSNAAQLEAMRSGRLHVAGVNTGANPVAVTCAGFVPFAIMGAADGKFGYEMEIIVPADSPIQSLADLKGRTLAFTAKTSNSGFKAPSALLKSEFGLEAEKDYKVAFSGKHDNSILGVANKDYVAAAVANSVLTRMFARGVVKREQIKSLFKSGSFPTTAYGVVHNLKPELAKKIEDGFFSFPWEGSALMKEFQSSNPPNDHFLKITYKQHWQIIRDIDATLNVSYACK